MIGERKMGKIIKIDNTDIMTSLLDSTRQYFVGNLSKPQQLTFIRDDRLEIGISSYPEFKAEPTHIHDVAVEYQYMVSGYTEYMDVDTGEVYIFKEGDFFAIEPKTSYSQRVKAGTNILFIKVPSINDKRLVEINEDQLAWLNDKNFD